MTHNFDFTADPTKSIEQPALGAVITTLTSPVKTSGGLSFQFRVTFGTSANNQVVRYTPGGTGLLGVRDNPASPGASGDPNEDIIGANTDLGAGTFGDEFITFTLSVINVSTTGPNHVINTPTFTIAETALVSPGDEGKFSGFGNGFVYQWDGDGTDDFTGHDADTPAVGSARFRLQRMNSDVPLTSFRQDAVAGAFLFQSISMSVLVNPEPSSFMLGLVAAMIGLGCYVWRRRSNATKLITS